MDTQKSKIQRPHLQNHTFWQNIWEQRKVALKKNPVVSGEDHGLRFLQRLSMVGIFLAYLLPILGISESGYSICWLYNGFHLPCPGCGLTRSVISFYHLELSKAWFYNPFGILIAFSFLVLSYSGFSTPFTQWLIRYSNAFKKAFLWYFILMTIAGIFRIVVMIQDPQMLGDYAIVNSPKTLFNLLPLFRAVFSF